jgi:ABC-type transport system involved in cytochrome bd biosynthesis fused ATPase/permease subunit
MWIVDNLILFISLVVTFVVIVVIVVIFVRKRVAKRQKEIAENKAALENKIMISNQNYENLKQQHEQEKNARVAAEQRKRMEEESERLVNVMRVKNLYPRLQCNVSGSMFSYSISKPVTKVGRNEANDLVLAHMTVSSFHAEIIFDGFSFVLYNRSNTYKQGIIVNGQFYQQCALRNGDIIGFGEAVVTFYI